MALGDYWFSGDLSANAGSQGEYAGLLSIKGYLKQMAEAIATSVHPNLCYGTNPASAVMAGMVKAIACDENGNIDVADLRAKAEQYSDELGANGHLPSTMVFSRRAFEIFVTSFTRMAGKYIWMAPI